MDNGRLVYQSGHRNQRDDRTYRSSRNWQENNSNSHFQHGQGRQSERFGDRGSGFRPQRFQNPERYNDHATEASLRGQHFGFRPNTPTQVPVVSGNMSLVQNVNLPHDGDLNTRPKVPISMFGNYIGSGTVAANTPSSSYKLGQSGQTYPNSNNLNYFGGNFPPTQLQQPQLQFPLQQFPPQPLNIPPNVFNPSQMNLDPNLRFSTPSAHNFNSLQNRMLIPSPSGLNPPVNVLDKANSYMEPMKVAQQQSAETDNAKKQKSAEKANKRKEKQGSATINEGQTDMRNLIVSMATLKHQVSKLENILNDGFESNWLIEVKKTESLKEKLMQLQSNFNQSGDMKKLKKRIAARRKKRERLKEKKQKLFVERQEAIVQRDIKESKIDKWRETVTQEMFDIKQKAEMKKMADKTLNSVRSKISETSRKLDLLKGLQRLRKIRMEAAIRIGRYTPDESEESFENQISKAYSILTNQREVYEGEEKTLKVLLEAEQEENKDLAKQKKQQIEEHRERLQLKKRNEMLFGKKVSFDASEPQHTFYQYYNQANENFTSFLQIRQSWDCYIVENYVSGSSRIPDGWVLPPLPSNDTWAKYLQT